MSVILSLYKKLIIILVISGVFTLLKYFYLNSNFAYHKVQQHFFQNSTNTVYIVASIDSTISSYFNKIEKNTLNLFQKPHYKVIWDNTKPNVIIGEYFVPKKIDYIQLTDEIDKSIKNNLQQKKKLELNELVAKKRLFAAFHVGLDYEKLNFTEFFYFETNKVSINHDNIPLYRTFIVFFVILSILVISYDYYKNRKY